jgi:energy-coupling factor transporter ATP-binding protein EcfA2
MNFKIIALRPLPGCKREYRKILKPGQLYYFYNKYTIIRNAIRCTQGIPDDFYTSDRPEINVSAIVGKNGSGKSSLIELFIQAINNISLYFGINPDEQLEEIRGLKVELYFQSDAYYKFVVRDTITLYKQPLNGTSFKAITKSEFAYGTFFYSIVVNYSHYGLNSREIGTWVDGLFHKNDGYQVPMVLNPQRIEGKIDINTENSLAKARLIANILTLSPDKNPEAIVINDRSAYLLKLTLKNFRNPVIYSIKVLEHPQKKMEEQVRFLELDKGQFVEILNAINNIYRFGYKGKWETADHVVNVAHRYIIRKLVRITINYSFYSEYFDRRGRKFNLDKLEEFLGKLFGKDENHISFKLKQTLNFLKFRHIATNAKQSFYLKVPAAARKIDSLIKKHKLKKDAVIELIPPPIFETDIVMRSPAGHNIKFSSLSSGEKQQIYSVSSVMYHLINIDSISSTNYQKGYRFVNIVLEEIELYFHPDMQREFVNLFLKRIGQANFRKILAINICFVTHSPFILSDIPASNILFLRDDGFPDTSAQDVRTFGANIHDLLKHSFFLKNGSMGDFAQERINQAINFINCKKLQNELKSLERAKVKNGTMIRLRKAEIADLKDVNNPMTENKCKELIGIIGEPVLQTKLSQMYDEIARGNTELEVIESRIADLKRKKSNLTKKK